MKKFYIGTILFLIILLLLIKGCNSKKTIIGKWKSIDTKSEYYYIFNEDKTCSYEMTAARLDCTYEVNENIITILYKGNTKANSFEYRFEGNTLIIKDDKNNDNKFIKEK